MTRDEQCNALDAAVRQALPGCRVVTNKGFNPATPLCVTVRWPNNRTHHARARSIQIDFEAFKRDAIAELLRYDARNKSGSVVASAEG